MRSASPARSSLSASLLAAAIAVASMTPVSSQAEAHGAHSAAGVASDLFAGFAGAYVPKPKPRPTAWIGFLASDAVAISGGLVPGQGPSLTMIVCRRWRACDAPTTTPITLSRTGTGVSISGRHRTYGELFFTWKPLETTQTWREGFCDVRQPASTLSMSQEYSALALGTGPPAGLAEGKLSGRVGAWRVRTVFCGLYVRDAQFDISLSITGKMR